MGLDVYLRKLDGVTLEEAARIEAEYENRCEENWMAVGGYRTATEEQKEQVRAKNAALAAEMGLGEWDQHPCRQDAEVPPSKVDPDHYFKLNYLRSSYNEGGINHVLRNAGVADLYGIFGREDDDQYHWRPDWRASLDRVNEAIDAYAASLAALGGNVRVMKVRHNAFVDPARLPSSEAAALEIYRREASWKHAPGFNSYGNSLGEFYLDGLTVRALIPGVSRRILGNGHEPVVYAVIDVHVEEGKEDWYLTALKITREMIEFVLAQPDSGAYYLTWSA